MADTSFFDLSGFPPPRVIEELNAEAIITAGKADFLARWNEERASNPNLPAFETLDLDSEPVAKLIQVFAFRETLTRARVNDAARASLLAFAEGTDLDHLAAFYDVTRLTSESDAAFKRRVILTIQGRSTGGTEPRYRAIALGADVRVADAAVYVEGTSPLINVAVYSTDNNGVPDAALLAKVRAALEAADKRMVNDRFNLRSAVFSVVDVVADVWLLPETPDAIFSTLPEMLKADWKREAGQGFDLEIEWLEARLMRSGVKRVQVLAPTDAVKAEPYQAISLGTVTLNNRGRYF